MKHFSCNADPGIDPRFPDFQPSASPTNPSIPEHEEIEGSDASLRLGQTHSPSAMAGEPQQPQPSPDEECAQEEDDQSHNARGIPPLSHLPVSHEASGAVPH
uniref:Uncharacterized protein n=1 Tax=Chrysemys picta bellii TaxID=8478 RepID=A0A8C3HQ63_CHRPI